MNSDQNNHTGIASEDPRSEGSAEQLSYFVATLDYAQCINIANPHEITTINQLLDERATSDPDLPVIGMPVPCLEDKQWGSVIYTFQDIFNYSNKLAHQLASDVVPALSDEAIMESPPTVAILAQSSAQLLMTFLALLRIGYSVLLIAPQCTQRAISHLLKTTESTHIFFSTSLENLAKSCKPTSCKCHVLPQIPQSSMVEPYPTPSKIIGKTTAYIHHTSGSSTGLPKLIPHSHAAATSHLPYLPPHSPTAAFSTTPLYHGGTADVMRSLMSSSMLWIYPPSVPMTSGNILNVLQAADRARLPVKLLTAVPYVLEVCASDKKILHRMARMDMVGVGGAPLGTEVGKKLVERGVKLVSRFGSSECGFLMSSHRNFATDQDWEYLRISPNCTELRFEPQSENSDKYELIVLPSWPQIAKPNRRDGSYATGDLFAPHPIVKGAYKYQGRNDAIIVLSNGKKFDPTAIEEAFKEAKSIAEAIVFGNGRAFPGVLLFLSERAHDRSTTMLRELAREVTEKSHLKIMEEMIVIMGVDVKIPKSSKGAVMRGAVNEIFRDSIDKAYQSFECLTVGEKIRVTDVEGVEKFVYSLVKDITGRIDIEGNMDLFAAGVDSVMAAQIRNRLAKSLDIGKALPLNVVFEQRTIEGLVRFITTGGEISEDVGAQQMNLMLHLVEKYGNFGPENKSRPNNENNGEHVVSRKGIKKIICLCRAKDNEHAWVRVGESLLSRKLPSLKGSVAAADVMVYAAELGRPDLGLGDVIYQQMRNEVTAIIHAAWAVNFVASLESFERDHIAGIRNLLDLTLNSFHQSLLYFCSSTAAVLGDVKPGATVQEKFTSDPRSAAPLGYGRSKWIAEKICQNLKGRAKVLRIGQLCADTVNGVWNETEAWPLMFASVNVVGCLPELDEKLSWLPVDIAAKSILDIALSFHPEDHSADPVFHLVNTDTSTSWNTILDWIQELEGTDFDRVTASQWIERLADTGDLAPTNSSLKLLGLWQANYGEDTCKQESKSNFNFEVKNTATLSDTFKDGGGWRIEKEYVQRIWKSWVQSGFVKV